MFCRYCGEKIPDEAKFCGKCGAEITAAETQESAQEYEKTAPQSSGKHKKIAAVAAVLGLCVVVALILGIFVLPNLEVNTFKSQIEQRQYLDAFTSYDALSSENQTKANKWIAEYIAGIETKYYEEDLDYATAAGILEEMKAFEAAYDTAARAEQNIYMDRQSSLTLEDAKSCIENGLWLQAYLQLENIHIKYRLYDEVASLREECITNYRADILEQLSAYAQSGEIDLLIDTRDNALTVLSDDEQIIKASQEHLDAYVEDTLVDAAALAEGGDYTGATALLQYAVTMYDHKSLWTALNSYGYEAAAAHCAALAAQGDLLGAVAYAQELAAGDVNYADLLSGYAAVLVENTLAEAKTYADNRQFEQAVLTLTTVQVVYDCAEITDAINEYSKYTPRKLAEIYIIDSEDAEIGISATDCFGTTYENIVAFDESYSGDAGGFAIFNLDGCFVNLSGCFVGSNELYKDMTVSCKFYTDGVLLYESPELGRTSEPAPINLDITGVKQLRVEYMWYSWWTDEPCCILDLSVS